MPEMDKTVIIVSAVVGSLGLLSAILGFAAESTNVTGYRRYRRTSSAAGLGVGAAIFLLAAQITTSAVSCCCGCCKSRAIPSETKPIAGIICAVFSWIVAVIAFVLFLVGTGTGGVFASAGVLTLIATALGITSFIMMRSQPADVTPVVEAAGTTIKPRDQQPPPVVYMVAQPQLPKEALGSENKPGVEELPAVVGMDHLQSSPAVAAGAPNKPRPEAPTGHTQPQLAAPEGTPSKPNEQASQTGITAVHSQVPLHPVYFVQPQTQSQYHALPLVQDEQPLLSTVTQSPQQFQPAAAAGAPNMPVFQPPHTGVTAVHPQIPLHRPVCILQSQQPPPYHVLALVQEEQPLVGGVTPSHQQLFHAAAASAPNMLGLQPLHTGATDGHLLHQVHVMQPQPQYPVQPQVPPTSALPQVSKPEKRKPGIGKQLLDAGVELGANFVVEVVKQSLYSDNPDAAAMTTEGDPGATEYGDACC